MGHLRLAFDPDTLIACLHKIDKMVLLITSMLDDKMLFTLDSILK